MGKFDEQGVNVEIGIDRNTAAWSNMHTGLHNAVGNGESNIDGDDTDDDACMNKSRGDIYGQVCSWWYGAIHVDRMWKS